MLLARAMLPDVDVGVSTVRRFCHCEIVVALKPPASKYIMRKEEVVVGLVFTFVFTWRMSSKSISSPTAEPEGRLSM